MQKCWLTECGPSTQIELPLQGVGMWLKPASQLLSLWNRNIMRMTQRPKIAGAQCSASNTLMKLSIGFCSLHPCRSRESPNLGGINILRSTRLAWNFHRGGRLHSRLKLSHPETTPSTKKRYFPGEFQVLSPYSLFEASLAQFSCSSVSQPQLLPIAGNERFTSVEGFYVLGTRQRTTGIISSMLQYSQILLGSKL